MEVFLERGYADTRVQDITDAAFHDRCAVLPLQQPRMEILAEPLVTEGKRLVNELSDCLSSAVTGQDPITVRLADQLTDVPRDVDRLMLEAITISLRDDEARTTIVSAFTRVSDRLYDLMENALAAGRLDASTDPQAATLL